MGAIKGMPLLNRLILAVFTSCVVLASAPAAAEDYAVAQGYLHTFNNNLSVATGVFALNKDFSLDTSVYLKYTVDVISPDGDESGHGDDGEEFEHSGSGHRHAVAAVSSASTAAGTSDTRHDITAGISHNFGNIVGVEVYYDYSKESDYTSSTPLINIKKDLFDKNTTLTLGFSRNMDRISGKFMDGAESRETNNYFFGITQVLSPVMVAQLGYARNESTGFEAEGIRLVPLNGADASTCTAQSAICVDERFPDTRNRNAYIFNISRYFKDGFTAAFKRASIKLDLRYYDDSWDIRSYTGEIEYYKYLSEQLVMRLDYRYYTQTKAFFVKDQYTGSEEFLSASPQLLKFNSNLAGLKLAYNFKGEASKVDGSSWFNGGSVEGKYEYYTESIKINGHILMAALRLLF